MVSSGVNNDNTIRIWDLEQAASGMIWTQAETNVTQVLFTNNGESACACSESSDVVHIRAITDGKMIQRLGGNSGGVLNAAISPDDRLLACSTGEERLMLWDITEGKSKSDLPLRKSIGDVAFSNNGRLLGGVASDSRIDLVELASKTIVAKLQAKGESYLSCFGFSRDDQLFAAVGADSLWIWNVDTGKLLTRLDGSDIYYSICFTEDKEHLVLEGPLEELTARSLATGAVSEVDERHRRAFALAKGRDPDGWKWYLPDPNPKEGQLRSDLEVTLLTPEGNALAWLPFRFGHIFHHPSGRIWAVLREGQFYLLTIEDVG
jgi:WD40 repeat protein